MPTPRASTRSSPSHAASVRQVFINSKATLEEGRKLPKKHCVDDPQLQEVMDVLTHLEFEFMIEVNGSPSLLC